MRPDSCPNGIRVEVQYALDAAGLPQHEDFARWAGEALAGVARPAEVVIRVVDAEESADLNATYRHKAGPTNVLSFPADVPPDVGAPLLGDIVICAPLVKQQAQEQRKTEPAHWAHMVVHGILHLLGYDHEAAAQAERMERLEVEIMERMGFEDPYL